MRYIILLIFIIGFQSLKAQIEKGTILPSAGINIWGQKSNNRDSSKNTYSNGFFNSGINLSLGKFTQQNLLMAGGINYSYRNSSNETKQVNNSNYQSYYKENQQDVSISYSLEKFKFISPELAFKYGFLCGLGFSETNTSTNQYQYMYYDSTTGQNVFGNVIRTTYNNALIAKLNLNTGFVYFLTKSISLNANVNFLNYQFNYSIYQKIKNKGLETSHTFYGFPNFNNFSLGVSYFIRPKKN